MLPGIFVQTNNNNKKLLFEISQCIYVKYNSNTKCIRQLTLKDLQDK